MHITEGNVDTSTLTMHKRSGNVECLSYELLDGESCRLCGCEAGEG